MNTAIIKTRKEKVLDTLSDGEWHDGYDLCHPSVGGSEGLRRLRELRADGHSIAKRLKPDRPYGSSVHQYRLEDDLGPFAKVPDDCSCIWEQVGKEGLRVDYSDQDCPASHPQVIR